MKKRTSKTDEFIGIKQEYLDRYDRMTIKRLRELEREWKAIGDPIKDWSCHFKYINTGVYYARRKNETIQQWMREDERHESMRKTYAVPASTTCKHCGNKMLFSTHIFDFKGIPLLFAFDCPGDHKSRSILYPDGREYILPTKKCSQCGGRLQSKTEINGSIHKLITYCSDCDYNVIDEIDCTEEDSTIDEVERKKYCHDFIGRKTIEEDLIEMGRIWKEFEESQKVKNLKEELNVEKIRKLTIPQLETVVFEVISKEAFIKLQLDTPTIKTNVTINFNVQDSSDRTEKESINILKRIIKKALLHTNWRLQEGKLMYRLGFLSGTFRAYETDGDLLYIAKQIAEVGPEIS